MVGAYPQSPEMIDFLRNEMGVTAVLNLQSDDDLYGRAIDWNSMWKAYVGRGMEIERVPIVDLSPRDLARHMEAAVNILETLLGRHQRVYVHCNVGLNRSPTVVIAYLVSSTDMGVDEAVEYVMKQRDCIPYPDAIRTWLKKR